MPPSVSSLLVRACAIQTLVHQSLTQYTGWQLGSDPEIQVPNLVTNHLTTGLLNYVRTTGRYASGINLFEKLRTRDPEISSLLARVYIMGDEEVKAVQLLRDAIHTMPMDYPLLDCQAEYCLSKGRSDLALEIGAVGHGSSDPQLVPHVHLPGQGLTTHARACSRLSPTGPRSHV
jgi:hypothetical protein